MNNKDLSVIEVLTAIKDCTMGEEHLVELGAEALAEFILELFADDKIDIPQKECFKSTDETLEDVIWFAARYILKRPNIRAFFEHGQWWIVDNNTGAQWSAVDAEGGNSYCGLDFEMVKEDEE